MATSQMIALTAEQLQQLIAGVAGGRTAAAEALCAVTLEELWSAYWAAEQNKLLAWKVQRTIGGHLVRLLGDRRAMDLTVDAARSYRATRRTEKNLGRRNTGAVPGQKTINNEIIVLLRVLRWGARQRPPVIPHDPLGSIDRRDVMVPVDNVRLNVVDDTPGAELSLVAFLAKADPLDRALVLVAHSSGMRRREVALLEWRWINREQRLVTIPPGVAKGRLGHRKGRTTIISEEALAAIDEYRATLSAEGQRRPHVFVNRRNLDPYVPNYLSNRFRKLQRRVGLVGPSGPVWLHDLRRSFITLARRRGEDAVNVMTLVGHSTLESQQRYHVESLEETKLIRDRIERARAIEAA